jgi:deoxycytidine triphosphate deaminase
LPQTEEGIMTFLTDTDLDLILCTERRSTDPSKLVIHPYEDRSMTPVGYDLRVGATYTSSDIAVRRNLREGEKIVLKPKTTALISTLEFVAMPRNGSLTGLIHSKVSQVSRGLSHISTTVDADWKGELLIAVHNHSLEDVELRHGEPFCTMVFLKNSSPPTRESDKTPGRLDIFLDDFREKSQRAKRRRRYQDLVPPAIVVLAGAGGYVAFGNNPGFVAAVTLGVALSQFVQRRYLR